MQEAHQSAKRQVLSRTLALFAPHRRRVTTLGVTILVGAALGMGAPLITKLIFDDALFPKGGEPDVELLLLLVGAMILLIVLSGLAQIVQAYLATVIGQAVMHDLRDRLYRHLHRMSLRFFTGERSGEIQSRITNDVGDVGRIIQKAANTVVANITFLIASLVAMAVLSWQLALISLALLPAFAWMSIRVGRIRREITVETQETLADMSTITQETLSVSGALLAKVFARQREAIDRYQAESRRLTQLRVKQEMVSRVFIGLSQIFFLATPALLYLGAGLAMSGGSATITAGTLVALTALQIRLFSPLREVLDTSVEMQSAGALFDRIFHYLDMPEEISDSPDAKALPPSEVKGAIAFSGVHFRYAAPAGPTDVADAREWTLQDVGLEIAPGQLAALVGPSGAGKTTCSYLMARLYDVERGSVTIDGHDVRRIRLSSLADAIGMVTQEPYLLNASIRDNLLYARPDAREEELEAAARLAFIHDRIRALDEGYDTIVGERGYRMSGGEKQRLAIARVILKDPRILILDEATSSLDTTSERLVQSALQPLMADRTTVAIAHRLSTILAADVIFVLDRGRLIERGTHDELVTRGGLYARLYEQQFQAGAVEARCEDGVVLSSGGIVR